METKKPTPKIYLKDLIFAVIHQWKRILIVALIAAFLLGSVQLVVDLISLNNPEKLAQWEADNTRLQEQYDAQLSALELQSSNLVASIKNQQIYLDNAPLMKMDPYNHFEGTIVIFADTNYKVQPNLSLQNPDYSSAVVTAYHKVLLSSDTILEMSELLQVDALYLPDLIKLETGTEDNPIAENLLVVHVKAATEEEAELMLQVVNQQIQDNQKSISDSICKHSLRTVEQTVTPMVDSTLATTQQTARTQLDKLMKDLDTIQTKKAALSQPDILGTSIGAVIIASVKLALIGAVAVVFVAAVIICFIHIGSDRVCSRRALSDRTCVKLLGVLSCRQSTWSDKLEGRCCTDMDADLEVLSSNIRNRCQDAKQVLITGSAEESLRASFAEALRAKLPAAQIADAGDILDTAAAIDMLATCDTVILVEQCHISRYEEINRRCELIQDYNKQLLGCVLFGG